MAALFSVSSMALAQASPGTSSALAASADAPLPDAVWSQLKSRGIREDQLFLVARPLRASGNTQTQTWQHNTTQAAQVASLVKLFTTGFALSRLGPEYGFRTDLLGQRTAAGDAIEGPLYLRGSGDPDFQVEDLWVLLRQLRQSGVSQLRGPLVLDETAFSHRASAFSKEPEGSFTDDGPYRAYHARPSAVLLGHGALGLLIRPKGTAAGGFVKVEAPLAPTGLTIDSQIVPKTGDCVAWKDGFQVEWASPQTLRIRGSFPVACGEQRLPVRIPDAAAWLSLWVTDIWRQLGGQGPVGLEKGPVPSGVPVVQSWRGRDLGLVVRNINKFSNNVMAQNLMLSLTPPGQTTQDALVKWLTGLGITSPSSLVVGNGSGLSRTDRVPAGLLAEMLEAMYVQPVFPELLASLPRAGADGTLSRRLGNLPVTAYLKTGRLKGVSGLGGYLRDGRGRVWVWVSVLNGEQLEDRSDVHDLLLKSFTSVLGG